MKKLALALSLVVLSANIVMASSHPKYDAELSKIRTVKNAQTSVINSQIKEIAIKIEALEADTTMTASQKKKQLNEYNAELDKLTNRKNQISEKYKTDKARLKRMYK